MTKPAYFFFFYEGKICAYHLTGQAYYEVNSETFDQLVSLNNQEGSNLSPEKWAEFSDLGFVNNELAPEWQGDILSHVAHMSSRIFSTHTNNLKPEDFVAQYTEISQNASHIPDRSYPQTDQIIALPKPDLTRLDQMPLSHVLKNRKTSREFNGDPLDIMELSDLLYSCFGAIHGVENQELDGFGLKNHGLRRSSPSSTGLASCDAILWAHNVNGLEKGLYTYHEREHTLLKHEALLSEQDLIYAMLDQFWLKGLSAGIFVVNDMRRTWVKDIHCRGYIASHQEAGHISQTLLLTATALGLQTWLSGSFRDDYLMEKLDLTGDRFVSLFVGLGHGTGASVSKEYLSLLNEAQ